MKSLLRVGQHPSPSALPSTAGGGRELREDCLSEASSAAPAQLASRAGDRRRQPTAVMRGAFSLCLLSLWACKEKVSRPERAKPVLPATSWMNASSGHLATSSRLTACPATAGSALGKPLLQPLCSEAGSVAVRPAPTGQAKSPPQHRGLGIKNGTKIDRPAIGE